MPLTKPKGVGEITSVTTPLVHTRSRCSVLSTLLEPDQRCPPWPTAATADAMRTPCGRKPYLRLLDRCFLPALTAFTLGQDLIVLLFLTTFAYLLMHQNRDLPAGAVTISNDDQLSLAMDHIASSGIGIATGKLIAFRCALMIGACLRIVQFLSWKLPFAEAEVSVLPPFLLSTFRQCENHPRASAKLMFASIRPISLSGAPMKLHILALLLVLFAIGCGSNVNPSATSPRSYNGTASVGDFLTITLDPAAHTLTYNNLSNLDTGTIPYTVNSDGTYALNDPTGNLIAAYEVPNYALLVQATKTGPNHDALALVTAVDKGTISTATWAGHGYNYMQFRTSSGGVEVGSAIVDAQGNVSVTGYWPYGSIGQGTGAFNIGNFDASTFHADPSGTFLTIAENNGTSDYVFGTPNGIFAVDTPNGAILGLKKAASKNFDASFAGTYKAIYYQKTGANTGPNNTETGTASLGNATLAITSGRQITISDSQGSILVVATLQPVADTSYLYGQGELGDPCNGLFTFRLIASGFQQDVFVTFMDRAILFSSFRATLPWGSGNTYDYLYGVGLK